MDEHEGEHDERALAPQELHERAEVGNDRFAQPAGARRLTVARRLAHQRADQHRGQREQRARDVGRAPADARGEHQRERARGGGADAPAVLRHAGTGAELARLEKLDAVGVDDDVEGRARHPDHDGGDRDEIELARGVGEAEKRNRRHDQHAHEPEPAASLPEAADDRQAHVVDDRRP